ncbi:TPA: ead/Ea22-like family protein [Klebsiella aerogenes]|nr:ead/Ea22-like family protein [Klebsiella aerogenes]HCB3011693.1 ead/Ea22-like family protein [Klebsiella aerogenes]
MTTDITELSQSLKAAAEKATPGGWRAFQYYSGRCGISGGRNAEIMVCEHISKERPEDAVFIALASPANILALVEALEKAQGMEAYWKTQCRGITDHCEELQARIAELEREKVALASVALAMRDEMRAEEKRVAELEESHAQVIQSRDHYKRISEEGLKQLAEPRTFIVKLPHQAGFDDPQTAYDAIEECKAAIAAAGVTGIMWEVE